MKTKKRKVRVILDIHYNTTVCVEVLANDLGHAEDIVDRKMRGKFGRELIAQKILKSGRAPDKLETKNFACYGIAKEDEC